MKYILFSLLLSTGLIIPQNSFAQTADNTAAQNTACSGKSNGASCSYQSRATTTPGGPVQTSTANGFCDRRGGAGGDTLYCNTTADGWEDCYKSGDACKSKSVGQLGTCSVASAGNPMRCDTTKKPSGTPGGLSPNTGASPGGGTCQDCGGNKCDPGEVCITKDGKPVCDKDSGQNNTCGGNKCEPGEVCITKDGKPVCDPNKCTGGGGAGNGGGGTTPSGNDTPTDATAPQTVGFINPIRFNSLTELIAGIINALLGILGAITVGVLVMSGFKYMISSNPGEVGQALDGIRNAIVGLMIIMGAFLITQYVISALAG